MATMTEVLDKLAEREKAMFEAEKEAATRVREAEAQVTAATESLLELKRRQEQELKVLKAWHEKRIRDTSYAWRTKVHKAQKESALAQAAADQAEKRQKRSEAHVTNLEQKINDLEVMIARRQHEAEMNISNTERMMDGRYARIASQADGRVRSMAEHAKEVCVAASASLETTADELQDQMSRASIRAEGRVRFKELRDLAKEFDQTALNKDAYREMKANLIDLWHVQSRSARSPDPGDLRQTFRSEPSKPQKSPIARAGLNLALTA